MEQRRITPNDKQEIVAAAKRLSQYHGADAVKQSLALFNDYEVIGLFDGDRLMAWKVLDGNGKIISALVPKKPQNTVHSGMTGFAPPVTPQQPPQGEPFTSEPEQKKEKRHHPVRTFFIILIVAALLATGSFFGYRYLNSQGYLEETSPALMKSGTSASITIEEGSTASQIAKTLYDAGVIEKTKLFLNRIKERDCASDLKPGTYSFAGGMSLDEVIDLLCDGPQTESVTIPEGYTLENIAKAVDEATSGRIAASDFIISASDASKWAGKYSFLTSAGTNSLEGFLFPKTYEIAIDDTADDVIEKMLSQFGEETTSLDFSFAYSKGLTLYDVVKLSSIVEKEGNSSNWPMVAGVFWNRLTNDGAPSYGFLQSDATTAYSVKHDPTSEEVHSDTDPYSTYTHKGLPPTPICSPSLDVMKAVCAPQGTSAYFFYFAKDQNGEVHYYFSDTYEQHQQAIKDATAAGYTAA